MAVKFQFKDNRVEREIIASKDDPIWCVNMKRGVINYLYLPITDNNEDYQTRQREVTFNKWFFSQLFSFLEFLCCVSLYNHGKQYPIPFFTSLL